MLSCDGILGRVKVWVKWFKMRKSLKVRGLGPDFENWALVVVTLRKGCDAFRRARLRIFDLD